MREIREFYRRVWQEYADPVHHPITARCLETQSDILRGFIEANRPRSVLDLGCGPRPVIHPGQASLLVSADLVLEVLLFLNKRAGYRSVCLDALRLPFREKSFDLVWCGLLVDHVGKVKRWIAELTRVLRPGGTLGLACWDRSRLPRDRYPDDRRMRYTCSTGQELAVTSYPNWAEALQELRRLDPDLRIQSHPIVPDQYVLQVAFAEIRHRFTDRG